MHTPPNIFRDPATLKAKGGYVYIMSNPSLAGNLLKIGKSDNHPSERKKQLETTGVPGSFVIEYYIKVENHDELERKIHDALCQRRPNKAREFFDVSVPVAIAKIREIVKGQKYDETVLYPPPDEGEREPEQSEEDRLETERLEKSRREAEKRLEMARRRTVRLEKDRLEKEQAERIEKNRRETERIEKVRRETEGRQREIEDRMNALSRDLTEILRETRVNLESAAKDDARSLDLNLRSNKIATNKNLVRDALDPYQQKIQDKVEHIKRGLSNDINWRYNMGVYEHQAKTSFRKVMNKTIEKMKRKF